jgi:hypothetical protein
VRQKTLDNDDAYCESGRGWNRKNGFLKIANQIGTEEITGHF